MYCYFKKRRTAKISRGLPEIIYDWNHYDVCPTLIIIYTLYESKLIFLTNVYQTKTILSFNLNIYIFWYFDIHLLSLNSSFEPWIGLHWRAYDQSFYWIDGEEMVFSNWFPPSPEPDGMQDFSTVQDDSNANENCVRVVGGFWRTRECNELQHVLCMGCKLMIFLYYFARSSKL